ncbi:MAG: hypothetical protein R3E89_07175 [Thiolinea sp.]
MITGYRHSALLSNAPDGLPNTLITEQNISAALSAYQRSQLFINNAWSAYIQGRMRSVTRPNRELCCFIGRPRNGYGCVNCHSGDFFSNEQFLSHTLIPPVGPGRDRCQRQYRLHHDPGRSLVTSKPDDRYKFRVPSLLNVEVTGLGT